MFVRGSRVMVPARSGSIISSSGISGAATHLYTCSKHACGGMGLTRNMAIEMGQHGIRVNCVSPYGVATESCKKHMGVDEEAVEQIDDALPRKNHLLGLCIGGAAQQPRPETAVGWDLHSRQLGFTLTAGPPAEPKQTAVSDDGEGWRWITDSVSAGLSDDSEISATPRDKFHLFD